MPESTYDINHFDYQQIPSLYILLQLHFFCWPGHDRTYNMQDPQGTSLLRNDYWFLDHKETFIFTTKIFASVIRLGHWLESGRSVSGTIPTGDRKWKFVPESVRMQGIWLQASMAQISERWDVTTLHVQGTHG